MTTPAYPNLQRGISFTILLGNGATPEVFTQLVIATSQNFARAIETEKHGEVDASNPTNLPGRFSVAKMQSFDLDISGRCDYLAMQTLEGWLDGNPHNVEIQYGNGTLAGAKGGGSYLGAVVLTSLGNVKQDSGTVTFTAKLEGQGPLPAWTANS
ncbi:MAG: hypothetical protein WB816_16025 [Methylocystis sp.]